MLRIITMTLAGLAAIGVILVAAVIFALTALVHIVRAAVFTLVPRPQRRREDEWHHRTETRASGSAPVIETTYTVLDRH